MTKLLNHCAVVLICLSLFACNKGGRAFTMVLLPDTQTYAEKHPEIFEAQTEWIAEHADEFAFVLQQGDLTQNNNDAEWQVVEKALAKLDGKIPYTFVPGNHDMGSVPGKFADVRNTTLMNQYLPLSRYQSLPTFGGAFEKDKVDNTYHVFKAGGQEWLVLSLEFGPRNEVLDWANQVVEKYPDHKIIVNTHAYLYSDSTRHDGEDWWRPQGYGIGKDTGPKAPNDGEQIWEKLVKKHPNMMFVFSGHVLHDGEGTLISEGESGNRVYQMLANYQEGVKGSEKGGSGYLRLITVNPKAKTVEVKTYSPYLDKYMTDPKQQFIFENVDLK